MARLYVEPVPDSNLGLADEATMVLGGQEFTYTDQDWSGLGDCLDDAVDETLAEANRHLAAARALMAGARALMTKRRPVATALVHVLIVAVLGVLATDLLDDGLLDGAEIAAGTTVVGLVGFELGRHAHFIGMF